MRTIRLLGLAPLILALGCNEDPQGPGDDGGPAVDCSAEVTEVDAEITTGADVVFSWSPRCRVAMLGVEAEDGDRWWIGVEEENTIEPPVEYGVTPDGVQGAAALPLVNGETYELILWIATSEGAYLAVVQEFER